MVAPIQLNDEAVRRAYLALSSSGEKTIDAKAVDKLIGAARSDDGKIDATESADLARVLQFNSDSFTPEARGESGQLVGGIGLRIDASQGIAELGYSLGKAWWGKGFATEAALAVTRHGFEVLKLHKVLACWFVGNEASGRVLEKAGFVREGIRRGQAIRFGKRLDLVDMAAFRDEWLAAHPA